MSPPIDKIPDEILLKVLDIFTERLDTNTMEVPEDAIGVSQEIGSNKTAIRLVCRRWSTIAKELSYKSISIRNVQDLYYTAGILSLGEGLGGGSDSWTPASHVQRIEIVFTKPFLSELETVPNDMLEMLVDIILSCPKLNTLSIRCSNWGTDMDIGLIIPTLLTACPSLERLELRLIGTSLEDDGALPPLNRHLCQSLKSLWVSSQVLYQLFSWPTTLPQLHALVVERTTRQGTMNNLTRLKNLRPPSLRSTTIFSGPELVSPINYQALATVSPQALNLFGGHLRSNAHFKPLGALGLFFRELGHEMLAQPPSLMQVTSITIMFKEERVWWSGVQCLQSIPALENNLSRIARNLLFRQLEEIKLWLPLPAGPGENEFPVIWESDERHAWKEQLEKIGRYRPGLRFYIGVSDECWRAKMWRKVSAHEAAEVLVQYVFTVTSNRGSRA
ncbi:hypothetical protein BKA70DRAFT_1426866 [Coprinopsis sp. MPI-PUGE-AT-0042]|nr:hypothetical protein BKA70DRAFT_1426866 [Coprinopsis sp. MPI-PUGE-AT-0042]